MNRILKNDDVIIHERPSGKEYALDILKHMLSLTFLKELVSLTAYYVVNHVRGMRVAHIASTARVRPTVLIRHAERVYIGEKSTINHNNVIWGGKEKAVIRIGNYVMTGPNVQMFAFNHGIWNDKGPMVEQPYTEADIIIEDDVWVGAGTTIVAGVCIGSGSVIAAGSVVTRDIPPKSIAGGSPAKVLKAR